MQKILKRKLIEMINKIKVNQYAQYSDNFEIVEEFMEEFEDR